MFRCESASVRLRTFGRQFFQFSLYNDTNKDLTVLGSIYDFSMCWESLCSSLGFRHPYQAPGGVLLNAMIDIPFVNGTLTYSFDKGVSNSTSSFYFPVPPSPPPPNATRATQSVKNMNIETLKKHKIINNKKK